MEINQKNKVVISGFGQTAVGEHWDISIRELAFYAIEKAMASNGGIKPQALYMANMLAPALSKQSHLATLVADFVGLKGIGASTIEAAGASGGMAFRFGLMAVASGMVDSVIVVGVEKLTEQTSPIVNSAFATNTDSEYEADQGLTPTAQAALLTKRYIYEYDVPDFAFSGFPIVAHQNGVNNENAMFRRSIKQETYQKAGIVSDPLNMFDVAPYADGAAAVILTRADLLSDDSKIPMIGVTGSSAVTDTLALHDRQNPIKFIAAQESIEKVFYQSGLGQDDIDLFELFDAYSVFGALSLEAAGFAEAGKGWELAKNGRLSLDGKIPISTFGGLKARGYPGGATGVYQIVEAAIQLMGLAGGNQVKDAKNALVQSLGGPASTVVTHILSRMTG
jgi:acetyl-CoA C-acetyltransferase